MENCSICGTTLQGLYCHQCGQKVTGKRPRFWDIFQDFFSSIFSLEKSVLATLWLLVKSPGKVIGNYWEGNKRYYQSPGKVLIYALFVIGLQIAFVDQKVLGANVEVEGLDGKSSNLLSPQLFFLIVMLPILTLSTYLAYLRQRHSLVEHAIAISYLFGCWAIILTVLGVLLDLLVELPKSSSFLLFLVLLFVWSARVFTKSGKWYRLLGNLLLEMLIFIALFGFLIALLYLVDPSSVHFS